MIRTIAFALALLICSCGLSVDIVVPSSPIQPGSLATLQLRDLPEKDQPKATITVSPSDGVTVIPASWGGRSFLIFQATRSGQYDLTLAINGWTKQLDDAVDIAVAAASPHESITELLKLHTVIKASFPRTHVVASITVAGEVPPPPPPPPQTAKRTIVILRETAESTPELSRLIVWLRDGDPGKPLRLKGHKIYVLDKDRAGEWLPHASGLTLPAIIIADEAGKSVLLKERLPTAIPDIEQLVKRTGGA